METMLYTELLKSISIEKSVEDVSANNYSLLKPYISVLDSISTMSYQSLYLVDYIRQTFVYVSENPLFLCGHSAEEVKKMGYNFYKEHTTKESYEIIKNARRAYTHFFSTVPIEEIMSYSISYDFYLLHATSGTKTLINHKFTPLITSAQGIRFVICMVSLSANKHAGNIMASRKGSPEHYIYRPVSKEWKQMAPISLTGNEARMLVLSQQGYSIQDIADKYMHKAVDTVKGYRRSVFEKFQTDNISAAIAYAQLNKLL